MSKLRKYLMPPSDNVAYFSLDNSVYYWTAWKLVAPVYWPTVKVTLSLASCLLAARRYTRCCWCCCWSAMSTWLRAIQVYVTGCGKLTIFSVILRIGPVTSLPSGPILSNKHQRLQQLFIKHFYLFTQAHVRKNFWQVGFSSVTYTV